MRAWLPAVVLLASATITHALPAACPDGRYLIVAGSDLLATAGVRPAVQVTGRRLAVENGCAPAFSRVRATPAGTVVRAWFLRCGGARVLRLRGRFSADCTAIYGELLSRQLGRVRFAAQPSACGDGIVDTAGGEACDPNDLPCTNGTVCSLVACRCEPAPPG